MSTIRMGAGAVLRVIVKNFFRIRRKVRSSSGATLFEYTLVLALVAIVGVLVLRGIGDYPTKAITPVATALE